MTTIEKCIKESFVVIGKEGSTNDGEGFIKKLWEEANSNFAEVEHLAKKDDNGNILGIWGAMSDFSHSFNPWENNFSQGLYLAGVECNDDSEAPKGWTKWVIPSFEYIYMLKKKIMILFPMLLTIYSKIIFLLLEQYMILIVQKREKDICFSRYGDYENPYIKQEDNLQTVDK